MDEEIYYDYYNDDQIQDIVYDDNDVLFVDTIIGNCIQPTIQQVSQYIFKLIFWSLICRFIWFANNKLCLPYGIGHIAAIICGLISMYQIIGSAMIFIVFFSFFSYIILWTVYLIYQRNCGLIIGSICITILIGCEIIGGDLNAKLWNEIRGIQMIATMKAISLGFDLNSRKFNKLPQLIEYLGYQLCPGNCILGPWIPFNEYQQAVRQSIQFNLKWIWWIIGNSICSMLFVLTSNCLVYMIAIDNSWKWAIAYRDALAFRNSHYFVSFLSQATMAANGLIFENDNQSKWFGFTVTKPWLIEMPRSLVQVVINWNIPMHKWLKLYIFNAIKPYSICAAIFLTYFISSLLHGLDFRIYAVLLSLGFYTFIEYNLRYKLSSVFSCCLLAQKCRSNCQHRHKSGSSFRLITGNFIFSLLTCLHLAYLGVLFSDSSNSYGNFDAVFDIFNKWNTLNFLSLWICIFLYIFNLLI